MQIRKIMSPDVVCCTRDSSLQEVARLMVEHDCGAIPVVNNLQEKKPIGIITDRDITCRAVAMNRNPLELTAGDCMTSPVTTVQADTALEDCCDLMEKCQVRRVVIVDENDRACGIVAQADIALHAPQRKTAHVVREVSLPVETE
jgi:CBS domain-containing protein